MLPAVTWDYCCQLLSGWSTVPCHATPYPALAAILIIRLSRLPLPTVQGELEKGIARVYLGNSRVVGASRTDGGAHAQGQVGWLHDEQWAVMRALVGAAAAACCHTIGCCLMALSSRH